MEQILLGKTIENAFINKDRTIIKLKCGEKFIDLITEGDCCLESWIEHIHGIESLKSAVIIVGVEKRRLGKLYQLDKIMISYIW